MRLLNCVLLINHSRIDTILQRNLLAEVNIARHIVSCANGGKALQYLEKERYQQALPELILLDLSTAETDGLAFLRTYKARGYHHALPSLLVVAAYPTTPYLQLRVAETGIAGFVPKPLMEGRVLAVAALSYGHQQDRQPYFVQ